MFQEFQKKAHYQNFEARRLEKLFANRYRGKSVLDIGCGQGRNFPAMDKAGCHVTGVDANAEQVAGLRAQGREVYTPENLPTGEKYDILLMSHIIEHMDARELAEFFNHYLNYLEPDGKFIVATPVLGERFYYDFTHIRPYYPQSLWMLIGGLDTAMEFKSGFKTRLEDIYFFRDAWKPRTSRAYYPVPDVPVWQKWLIDAGAVLGSAAHIWSGGRIGALASWMGIYGFAEPSGRR